jgi:hypothetical protein
MAAIVYRFVSEKTDRGRLYRISCHGCTRYARPRRTGPRRRMRPRGLSCGMRWSQRGCGRSQAVCSQGVLRTPWRRRSQAVLIQHSPWRLISASRTRQARRPHEMKRPSRFAEIRRAGRAQNLAARPAPPKVGRPFLFQRPKCCQPSSFAPTASESTPNPIVL